MHFRLRRGSGLNLSANSETLSKARYLSPNRGTGATGSRKAPEGAEMVNRMQIASNESIRRDQLLYCHTRP